MEVDLTKAQLEMRNAAMGHAFQLFAEEVRAATEIMTLLHCHSPRIIDANNIITDATFTLNLQNDEQWAEIDKMIGPEGGGRPYIRVFELIHFYPYRSIFEVHGQRISVSPIPLRGTLSHQPPPVHLTVAFSIRTVNSPTLKRLLTLPSRPRKWV